MKRAPLKSLFRNAQGTTIIEFAFVAPIFFILIMGIIEFGLFMMTQIAIESAVAQAGRVNSLGVAAPGKDLAKTVEDAIRQKVSGLPRASTVLISVNTLGASGTRKPDLCFDNGINNPPSSGPTCPPGAPFIDNNGNGSYEGNGGVSVGAPGDLVEIRASYPWRMYFSIFNNLVGSRDNSGNYIPGVIMITSTTVIKNEPGGS